MSHSQYLKNQAIKLRTKGYSYSELVEQLRVSKSTVYSWTHSINLNQKAQDRILQRREMGKEKSIIWRKEKNKAERINHENSAKKIINKVKFTPTIHQLISSCLYWAEGSKGQTNLTFTNSDPIMISTFLASLRQSFKLTESKFRVMIHLHEYHHHEQILAFWSQVTKIPLSQFMNPYLKPHTKKHIHPNYKGACSIRYYDASLAKQLTAIYRELSRQIS
jgi:hypothetical protein